MGNHILFVFEGERTERRIFMSLKKFYLIENATVIAVYCNNIYHLYKELAHDPDLDLFPLLKEKTHNKDSLSDISRDSVAEIYLFFDYDGHDTSADDRKVQKVISYFNEETDNGKVYISYPMVEALFHLKSDMAFKDVVVKAKNNVNYKHLVDKEGDNCIRDLRKLTKIDWSMIMSEHCKKLNYLMNDSYELPQKIFSQSEIFNMQKKKHIESENEVAVLSAFPIFIADYYGCYSTLS